MTESVRSERIATLGYDYGGQATVRPAECNLCGAQGRAVALAQRDRHGYPATLAVCRRCGLGYLSPRLSATQYAHFYSEVYRPQVSAYHGRRIDAETIQSEQHDYATRLAEFLLPLLPASPRTILDVGGSTGVVASVLAGRLNAHPTVLDPAPDELAVARVAGMETLAGFIIDHPYYFTRPTAVALFVLTGFTILAERLTDDGHRGFVLTPGRCAQPHWPDLEVTAAQFVTSVQRLAGG